MKKLLFVVNEVGGLKPEQSTTFLIVEALRVGHRVDVVGSGSLYCDEQGDILAQGCTLEPDASTTWSNNEVIRILKDAASTQVNLKSADLVWVRTNPARDNRKWAHENALVMLGFVHDAGTPVINDPWGLQKASSKLYLNEFPLEIRPKTVVSKDVNVLKAFMKRVGGACVVKPLKGTHGRDVFKLKGEDSDNVNQILEIMTRTDYVIAQEFVPEATLGDVRLLVVDGELFEVDGKVAAVHRAPGGSDFRSNIHAGGVAKQAVITPVMRGVIEKMKPVLKRDGIFFAGVDFIGTKIVEINVFSPGGLVDAEVFEKTAFTEHLIAAALTKCK